MGKRINLIIISIAAIGPAATAATLDTLVSQSVTSLGTFQGNYSGDMVDDGRRVHVVWQSQAGFFYASQARGASRWEQQTRLPIPPGSVLPGRPRLVLSSGRLFAFHGLYLDRWALEVSAGEARWRSLGPLLSASDPTFALGDVASSPRGIVLAGVRPRERLELMLGTPDGERFKRKTIMVLSSDGSSAVAAPALAVDGYAIHILWEIRRSRPTPPQRALRPASYLLHFYSADFGDTWRQEEIDVLAGGPSLSPFVILRGGSQWWILNQAAAGLSVRRAEAPFGAWQTPISVGHDAPPAVSAAAAAGLIPVALWVDNRYREQEAWGRIPFHQAIIWDRSPDWKNNDAFAVRLDHIGRDENTVKRLTAPLSHTESVLRAVAAGDFLYVLRKGRVKVGYTFEQFGAQPELFVHVIPMEGLR